MKVTIENVDNTFTLKYTGVDTCALKTARIIYKPKSDFDRSHFVDLLKDLLSLFNMVVSSYNTHIAIELKPGDRYENYE